MKVAILKKDLNAKGGLEKYTHKIKEAFQKKGVEVTLISATPKSFLPSFYKLIQYEKAVLNRLKQERFDVIFGMERNSFQTHYRAGSGVHAAFLQRRTLTESTFKQLSFRLNPLHQTILSLEKKCFENKDLKKIFTNSKMVKNEILSHYNVDEKLIEVVYNGAPYYEWETNFQNSFEKKKETFELLFIGNDYKRKGLLFLLNGIKLLKINDLHLSVVGYDKNLKSYEFLVKKMGLEKKVTFYGPQKNIIPFYQKADCLCIPSIYDPAANVTMEALCMGLFVVSSTTNGAFEILTEKTGSIIEDLKDPQSVKQSLIEALKHLKTKNQAISIRNSVKELDFSIQLDKIIDHVFLSLS